MKLENRSETIMRKFWRNAKYALPLKPLVVLIVLIFFILLPIICWNLQHSSYFIEGDLNHAAYLKRLRNNRRIAQFRSYVNERFKKKLLPFNYLKLPSTTIPQNIYPNLAFVVLATNRDTHKVDAYEPKYLSQTLHTLSESIDNDIKKYGKRWYNISISMCNVDKIPERFFELKQLMKYFDQIQVNRTNLASSSQICDTKLHFISCLDLAMVKYVNVQNFVIIEDDLLSKKDMMHGLTQVFKSLRKRFKSDTRIRWGFIQLFYPLHEIRFSFWDSNSWLELLLVSCSLVFLLFLVYFRLQMRSLFIVYNVLLLAILLLLSIAFVIAIGRPHWRAAYHSFTTTYSLVEPMSHSAAAVLVNRDFIDDLIKYTIGHRCYANETKWDFLYRLAGSEHKRILSVNVNLFKHVGMYSAFKRTIINPHWVE